MTDKFQRMRREYDGSALLTEQQVVWQNTAKLMKHLQLTPVPLRPGGIFRYCYDLVEGPVSKGRFDNFILAHIMLNTVAMCTSYHGMSPTYSQTLEWIDVYFTCIFSLEVVLKVLALGWTTYWRWSWNRFDFVVVVLGYLGYLFDAGAAASLVRIFRIFRVLRLIKRLESLMRLMSTLMLSLPSLWNISAFLFVVFFIFAVLGVQLFGRVGKQARLAARSWGLQAAHAPALERART